MSRLIMLPCAAYLRVYEPLSAFGEAERARWEAYAGSPDRPRRANALKAEHTEAVRRLMALPPIVAPVRESDQAYVRWADGTTYICPWQTRLRSWLALGRLRETARLPLADAFAPAQAEMAAAAFAGWPATEASRRVYIQSCTWSIPPAWFVPFAATERRLALGSPVRRGTRGPATASVTRTLVYATTMAQARRRAARGLVAVRRGARASALAARRDGDPRRRAAPAATEIIRASAELERVGRWLEEFHPHSLVELDYGGLVQLLDDETLRGDQSVADMSGAIGALAELDLERAGAIQDRLRARWQGVEAIELGS